jgi:hypothetical protein
LRHCRHKTGTIWFSFSSTKLLFTFPLTSVTLTHAREQ